MKSRTGLLPIALLLFVAAGVLWAAAARQTRVADARRALATLRYAQAAEPLAEDGAGGISIANVAAAIVDRVSALAGGDASSGSAGAGSSASTSANASSTRAAATYWRADYGAVAAADADPFLAANAAYRLAMRQGGDWREVTGRLDDVIARYADVLRRAPGHADAAYNYELVIRQRAAIAARQQPVAPVSTNAAAPASEQATPHGVAGAPPAAAETKSFKLIVPMRPEERQEAERAGKSGPRVRKG
jgi:hypothetical protein